MADNYLTLLDLAQLRGNDQTIGILESALDDYPEIAAVMGREMQGTEYTIGSRTSRPKAAFRNINEGIDYSKSTFSQQRVQCFNFLVQVAVDKAAAQVHPFGQAEYMADEAMAETKGILELIAKQFFYGQHGASDKGFDGLLTQVGDGKHLLAGGTNASVAADDKFRTSAFFVREALDGTHFVFGGGTNSLTSFDDEWREESHRDADGKEFPAYKNSMGGWIGLQAINNSVGVIHNITQEAASVFNDKIISAEIKKFKRSQKPTKIYLSQEAAHKLRESRSATTERRGARDNQTRQADGIWADMPTESNGIPIVISDAISDDEKHVAA
jgi:hypothetical protein